MEATANERVLIVSRDALLRGVANDLLETNGWLSATFSDPQLAFQYFCGHFHEIPAAIVDARDDVQGATDMVRRLVALRGDVRPFVFADRAPGTSPGVEFSRCFEPADRRGATVENVSATLMRS